jgi:hypothetical protein
LAMVAEGGVASDSVGAAGEDLAAAGVGGGGRINLLSIPLIERRICKRPRRRWRIR